MNSALPENHTVFSIYVYVCSLSHFPIFATMIYHIIILKYSDFIAKLKTIYLA